MGEQHVDALLPIYCTFCIHSNLPEHFKGYLPIDFVVFNKKHTATFEGKAVFLLLLLLLLFKAFFELQDNSYHGTLSLLALYSNGAAHYIHKALCYRHSKAGSRNSTHGGATFPGEGVEDIRKELLRYSYAVIGNCEGESGFLPFDFLLLHCKLHLSTFRSILDGVSDYIEENLLDLDFVAKNS